MKKYILILMMTAVTFQYADAQIGSYAGAFSRMGFGARGMSMGNSVSSDIFGDVSGIYNPALATFQNDGKLDIGYTFLSLDRKLNFVGFTKKFKLPNQDEGGAGITLAWINAGVSDIDGRDNDTRQIGEFSTFENQFYLGTSFILSDQLSIGVGFKLYYAKLFEEITTSSFAIDLGGIYRANKYLAIGITFKDLGAKYEWQTTSIYGANGNSTEDKFPKMLEISGTYLLPKNYGIISLGLVQYFNPENEIFTATETSTESSNNSVIRFGIETNIISQVRLRAGLDRIDFTADDIAGNLKPSLGFGLDKSFSKSINLGVDYSVQLEPFSHDLIQNIGIVFKFK